MKLIFLVVTILPSKNAINQTFGKSSLFKLVFLNFLSKLLRSRHRTRTNPISDTVKIPNIKSNQIISKKKKKIVHYWYIKLDTVNIIRVFEFLLLHCSKSNCFLWNLYYYNEIARIFLYYIAGDNIYYYLLLLLLFSLLN